MVFIYEILIDIYDNFTLKNVNDNLAEWSKASDLGSGPKERGFKSLSIFLYIFIYFHKLITFLLILTKKIDFKNLCLK